jgi:Leucine-rich repeat (LRR) protein
MDEIPDLSNFSQLKVLQVNGGESLKELTCSGPLAALEELDLCGCQNLRLVPDLSNFPSLNRDKFMPQDA